MTIRCSRPNAGFSTKPSRFVFFDEPGAGRKGKINRANDDVATDIACRRVDPTKIESQPIVAGLSVVVHTNAVAVYPDASVFVQIVPYELAFSQSIEYGSIAIEDVEAALDRPDAFGHRRICHDRTRPGPPNTLIEPEFVQVTLGRNQQGLMTVLDSPAFDVDAGNAPKQVRPIEAAVEKAEPEPPRCSSEQDIHVGNVGQPIVVPRSLQPCLELVGPVGERRGNGGDLTLQAANFAAGPFALAELGNRDPRTGGGPGEHYRITRDDLNHRIRKVGLPDQLGPIDRHDALRLFRGSRDELYAVTQLVSREPADPLLAQRKPIVKSRALCCFPLPCAVVVPGNKPDVADDLQRHPVAVVLDDDRCIGPLQVVQDDPDGLGVGIVGVLDQLEDSEPGRPDEFVPKKLKNASARSELQTKRRVAGFRSRTGHASHPRPRMLVEHPFGHRIEVAS